MMEQTPARPASMTALASCELEAEIESLAYGGEGVAHTPRTLFVAGTAPGDRVRVRVTEKKARWARGDLIEVLSPSPARREPPCRLAASCGGCQWQHVTEEAQREAKRRAVEDALVRIGNFGAASVPPVIFAGPALGYRRRTRLQLSWSEGRPRVGFNAPGSREVVDAPVCLQMSAGLQEAYAVLRDALLQGPTMRGLESVELAVGSDDGPAVAAFRMRKRLPGDLRQAMRAVATSLLESGCFRGVAILAGADRVTAQWGDLHVEHRYPAGALPGAPFTLRQRGWSFSQASWEANLLLVRAVLAALGEPPPPRLLELYAGSGNFTLPLSAGGMRVSAVEGNRQASEELRSNLAQAGLSADVVAMPVKKALERAGRADALLMDPPRSGAAEAIDAILALAPRRIVYVSCDPATLARDLRRLAKGGYRLGGVSAIDLFPQTYHVECVATCLLDGPP